VFFDFKVTTERVIEACGYVEIINLIAKDRQTIFRIAPRFVVDEKGEYSIKVEYNDNGLIDKFIGYADTVLSMAQVPPTRLEKLADELCEASKNVVNPPNGRGWNRQLSTKPAQPLPGSST
jgi:hypothetical protein